MIQLQDGSINIMYAERIPYLRVDVTGFVTAEQFKIDLSSTKLFDLIAEKHISQLLINTSPMQRFGTEDLDWMTKQWFSIAATAGIKRLSIVASTMLYDLFINLFNDAASKVDRNIIEVRFFPDNQFYETWESVAWFEG